MDLVRWKDAIKEFLAPSCYRFAADIRVCVKAVDTELKPSYMFDLAFVPCQRVIDWLKRLYDVRLVQCQLSVLAVEEQIFIVKRSAVKHRMSEIACGNERVIMVDVSANLQQPQSTSTELHQRIAQVVTEKLTTWTTDDAYMLELSPEVNHTTVFGLLLGYPVVYWYSNVTSADNCLSQVPLRLFRILAVDSKADSHTTVIYSFTVPEQLYSHCQSFVDSWQKHLFTSVSLDWAYSLHTDNKITVQSVVCM